MDSIERLEALFIQLVLTFQAAAWQQLGKIKNPLTDKVEMDLNQARFSIDILEMLKVKTKGNLGGSEERFLNHTLSELQLNYIAEYENEKSKPAEPTVEKRDESGSATQGETKSEEKSEGKTAPKGDSRKKK